MLHITPWERQALQLLAQGKPIDDIGASLGVSGSDVALRVKALFAKMGVTNPAEAIADALRRGLLVSP
ncbi:MAG TPA: helix-turn-helix domain-containing protein [Vicinamibacterales bacterium]|nr:helix-turn-helix domain-containing protein [Vicinamibacterales bacterium]